MRFPQAPPQTCFSHRPPGARGGPKHQGGRWADGGGQCGPLSEAGVQVYVDGYPDNLMHEKVIILDDSVVIAGSYNFTRSADKRNDEQVLVIQSKDIAKLFLAEFDKILEEAN